MYFFKPVDGLRRGIVGCMDIGQVGDLYVFDIPEFLEEYPECAYFIAPDKDSRFYRPLAVTISAKDEGTYTLLNAQDGFVCRVSAEISGYHLYDTNAWLDYLQDQIPVESPVAAQ